MVSVSVTPATATMLTCSTKAFSAGGASVTWSATDGTIDASGNYTAPMKVGPDVTITATSTVDTSVSGTATVTLETANVGPKQIVVDAIDHYPDVWAHAVASSGKVVYAAWGYGGNNDAPKVQVARSDDGGATWGTPVTASPAIGMTSDVSCIDLAIDAGDPNVVYVVFNFTAGSGLPGPYANTADDQGLALVVSTDGGKTFPTLKLLQTGNSSDPIPVAQGICPDVASPKADVVAVTTPGGSNESISAFLWVDASRGTGIGIAQADQWNMIASEETGALHAIGADIGQDGSEGDTTEAPQLFSDGKGTLCVTYLADTPKGSGSPSSAIWLQCSKDLGQTFGGPTIVSPTFSYSEVHLGHPTGLFAPNGDIVVAWRGFGVETAVGGTVPIAGTAISTDGGATFTDISPAVLQDANSGITNAAGIGDIEMDDTGVLWRTYVVGDGLTSRIAVDKTCDLGKTWSGPQVINGSMGTTDDATLPMLVATPGGQVAVYASATGNAGITYQMRRYTIAP